MSGSPIVTTRHGFHSAPSLFHHRAETANGTKLTQRLASNGGETNAPRYGSQHEPTAAYAPLASQRPPTVSRSCGICIDQL
jgi:hypothetical protein